MRVLLVEDDDDKAEKILEELARLQRIHSTIRAKSFDGALRALVVGGTGIDGVLLDMSMPNYDDSHEPPENFAGRDLLRQCQLRGISKPTVVITQLDLFGVPPDQLTLRQLNTKLLEEFAPSYLGVVYYNSAHESWRDELKALLSLMEAKL